MPMNQYGSTFYDLDITVRQMICLALLDNSSPYATDGLEEMTDDLDVEELAAVFGLDKDALDEDDMPVSYELIIEKRRGWLVSAVAMQPKDPSFYGDGRVRGYSSSGTFNPLLAYGETLEAALDKLIAETENIRHAIFNKARKTQGLPELARPEPS